MATVHLHDDAPYCCQPDEATQEDDTYKRQFKVGARPKGIFSHVGSYGWGLGGFSFTEMNKKTEGNVGVKL